jgi:hypothetical protein
MTTLKSVKDSIVTECEDDYVGLWAVVREVEEAFPGRDEAAIRDEVLHLLRELLAEHEIQAGYPIRTDRGFQSLALSPEQVIAQIEKEWPAGRRPTIGEGFWFTKP